MQRSGRKPVHELGEALRKYNDRETRKAREQGR